MRYHFETIRTRASAGVVFAAFDNPSKNLNSPKLIQDLDRLLEKLDHDSDVAVVVFSSVVNEYFWPQINITQIPGFPQTSAFTDDTLEGLLTRISELKQVTIAQIQGNARGPGGELALACDMRFAAKESAVFGRLESAMETVPGAGQIRQLSRLLGPSRAIEILLSSDDFNAELAERYGWINRAIPENALESFVQALAHRIAGFPAQALMSIKSGVAEVPTLAFVESLETHRQVPATESVADASLDNGPAVTLARLRSLAH